MVWIFERGTEETLRIETRYDTNMSEFVLIVYPPVGGTQVERFNDPETFRERLEGLEIQIIGDRWTQRGPMFLRDGWKFR
jgi:hypothetical protein